MARTTVLLILGCLGQDVTRKIFDCIFPNKREIAQRMVQQLARLPGPGFEQINRDLLDYGEAIGKQKAIIKSLCLAECRLLNCCFKLAEVCCTDGNEKLFSVCEYITRSLMCKDEFEIGVK